MLNVLETILEHKRNAIANTPDYKQLKPSSRSLYGALSKPHYGFIMECKKASPSKGLIRAEFDLNQIIPVYDQYADAISVLTEDRFFRGSFTNLKKVRGMTNKPLLCKDFILSTKQVRQARFFGADAVLLMLSVLNDKDYKLCHQQAEELNMDVLTEVHTEAELKRAIMLGANIIGINNRNLKDLSTSFEHTKSLAQMVPEHCLVITESGINSHQDVMELSNFSDACLVGSSLMKELQLEKAASQLVYGDVKICGVTTQSDADMLQSYPLSSIGLIFVPESKRCINEQAVTSFKPLVGVFQNQSMADIVSKVTQYKLKAVQLHGDESVEFGQELKQQLTPEVKISKVIHIEANVSPQELQDRLEELISFYDEVLLDTQLTQGVQNQRGGTGTSFDWSLLDSIDSSFLSHNVRIAGGIGSDNIAQLKQHGAALVDLSSSVESRSGSKCKALLDEFFSHARLQSGRHREQSNQYNELIDVDKATVGGASA